MSSQSSALVLINPKAGAAQADLVRQTLTNILSQHGINIITHDLELQKNSNSLVQSIKNQYEQGTTLIIAAGGDGTASYVARAIIHAHLGTQVRLGLFPSGTANTLAQELGIPADWTAAAHFLATCQTTIAMDAMQIGRGYYFLRIGIGLDAETIRKTKDTYKRRFGRWAYFQSFMQRLRTPQRHQFRCKIDGKKHRFNAVQVFIANGGGIALAPFRLGPGIDLADGQVNICAYDALTRWDYGKLLWHLLWSHYQRQPHMKFWSAYRTVLIKTHRPLPIQADGECIGTTPVRIRVLPGAIRVISNLPILPAQTRLSLSVPSLL